MNSWHRSWRNFVHGKKLLFDLSLKLRTSHSSIHWIYFHFYCFVGENLHILSSVRQLVHKLRSTPQIPQRGTIVVSTLTFQTTAAACMFEIPYSCFALHEPEEEGGYDGCATDDAWYDDSG
jgi:hypothetical protein